MKINAVIGNDYESEDVFDRLDKQEILNHHQSKWAGSEVVFFEETGSTNVEAKLLAEQGAVHGTLVAADSQSGGKGRRGRSWHSPKGNAIAMSLILKPELEPEKASMLTLLQAMAVTKALEEICGIRPQIKWPMIFWSMKKRYVEF